MVARLLDGFSRPWFVAGGSAIDLFVGRETRRHKDIEIAILRRDQLTLQRHLAGWQFEFFLPYTTGESRPWSEGTWLESPIHEIHGRVDNVPPLEILLNESDGSDWVFRRDHRVRRPLTELSAAATADSVPFLAPEIVLLYKAAEPGPADEADFRAVRRSLDGHQRQWLAEALQKAYPLCPWRSELAA